MPPYHTESLQGEEKFWQRATPSRRNSACTKSSCWVPAQQDPTAQRLETPCMRNSALAVPPAALAQAAVPWLLLCITSLRLGDWFWPTPSSSSDMPHIWWTAGESCFCFMQARFRVKSSKCLSCAEQPSFFAAFLHVAGWHYNSHYALHFGDPSQ